MTRQKTRVPDRRVVRTHKLLRDALHSLIREKDYDSIAVKEILDHANVGRSAFYMHFRDKDELLVSSIHDILGAMPSTHAATHSKFDNSQIERILWFSLPIFEHHYRHRQVAELKLGQRGRALLHGHLQKVLTDLIDDEVRKLHGRRRGVRQIPPSLLTQHVASTFILVLNWWVETKSPLPPTQVNDLFRTLILPTLTPAQVD